MNGAVNGTMEDPDTVSPPSPSADSVVSKKGTDEGANVETAVSPCNSSNGFEDTTLLDNSHTGEDPAVNSKTDLKNQSDESTDCPDLHNFKEQTKIELQTIKCSDEPSSTEDTSPLDSNHKGEDPAVNRKPDIESRNDKSSDCTDLHNHKEQTKTELQTKKCSDEPSSTEDMSALDNNHKGEDPAVNSKPDIESQNDKSSDCTDLQNHKEQSKTEIIKTNCSDDELSKKNCSSNDEETQDPVGSPVTKSEINEKKKTDESKCEEVSEDGNRRKTNLHKLMNYSGKMENNNRKEIEYSEDSDDISSDEDSEGYQRRPAETVSIDSDSDLDNHDSDTNDIVLVEDITPRKQNGNNYDSGSPEIHEIDSDDDNDDCIVTEDNISKMVTSNKSGTYKSPNKSKRKGFTQYDLENGEDGSDVEVISTDDDPLNTPTKKMKTDNNKNNEPSLLIVDTNSILAGKALPPKQQTDNSSNTTPINTSSLYQSIAARGTTMTAVKISSATPSTPSAAPAPPPEPLLPSLTDDMFVVEAPSFIVPYVYEKPSMKPFREFVDILGKELEEQKLKEEQERLEKEKLDKEIKRKEKQERKERRERGEQVESEVEEIIAEDDEKKKKSQEKKERRRRRKNPDDDDVSWDGESSSESEDDVPSDEDKVEIVKEIDPDIEEITDVITDLSAYKSTGKTDNYFDCSLGKFFMNIGLNLVTEYVQNDLLKQQNRKLKREKKAGHNTKATASSIASLEKNLELSKENNAPYAFKQLKCEFCSFRTESTIAMSHHLETPHMKNNLYKCNFCPFEVRAPHEILLHMEKSHTTKARLERGLTAHQCVNCPFEDNGKGKMARHAVSCANKFKPDFNLCPPVDWETPAKIPKLTKQRNTIGGIPAAFSRQTDGKVRPMSKAAMLANMALMKNKNNRLLPFAPRPATPPAPPRPVPRNTFNTPFTVPSLNTLKIDPKPTQQPSLSITPVPRTPAPPLPAAPDGANKGTFTICEICDGYIKDLEHLRNHMQWIHKVKIHPKMIYNRPPLNCQKCQFRFFTDKGLERHLLGSHGLVTSCMQEAANKGKDAGRCPVCGRVYQWKLLFHVTKDHNLTLKPAHLSYKCTVCTATFGMYKQFENHVYSAHRVVAKRVTDSKGKPPAAKSASEPAPKLLKINDEITITPQSKAGPTTSKGK